MDAFAVSITLGLSVKKPGIKEILIPGLYFGLFQALMPFIGYFAGTHFAGRISHLDHWVAFGLLCLIGGKMIKDSFSNKGETADENSFRFVKMLVLALATSIDALAIGITFALLEVNIFFSIAIIGFTTFFISMAGVKIGNQVGVKLRSRAELIGGAVLVILGFRILIEHLFLG